MRSILHKSNFWLFLGLTSLLAFVVWCVFQPGFMNGDAIGIYIQALHGQYDDWHPPIMAFTLKFFFDIGLGLKELMLLQVLIAFTGLFMAADQLLKLSRIVNAPFKAFLIVIGFSLPLSPFPYYAMGFIKDSWCVIFFLWMVGLSVWSYRQKGVIENRVKVRLTLIVLILFMVLAILVRHNALVLSPVFLGIIFYLGKLHAIKYTAVFSYCLLPVLLYFGFNWYAYDVKEVKRTHPERQVMAAELIGLIRQDSSRCESMEYICNYLTADWREAYEYGEVFSVMIWGSNEAYGWKHAVKFPEFDRDDPALVRDYYHALKNYPFAMAWVKFKSFGNMISDRYKYWFHGRISENDLGLELNKTFKNSRNAWMDLSSELRAPLKMFVANHPLWFFLNILLSLVVLRKAKRSLTIFNVFLLLLSLIPLAYYLSYLLAATSRNYRFMYPSTILIQIATVVIVIWAVQEKKSVMHYLKNLKRKYLQKNNSN